MSIAQIMINAGLNYFGAQLLVESLLRSQIATEIAEKGEPLKIFIPINRSDCAGWVGAEITLNPVKAKPDLYLPLGLADNLFALQQGIEAALAQPDPMTVIDIADDDALRFVQRVLESDAPEADRLAAREMITGIRTRVRKVAQPEQEPVAKVVEFNLSTEIEWLVDDFPPNGTLLYAHPKPERKPLSETEIQEIADQTDIAIVCHGEGDYIDNLDAIVPFARAIEAAIHNKLNESPK